MVERDEVLPFAQDVVTVLDARAAGVRPDFAAMMARVTAIAREADPLAPVLPRDEDDADGDGAGLGVFTGALKASLDAEVHERSLSGIPPLVAGGRRRRGVVVGVVLAMAAALVLFVVGPWRVTQGERGRGFEANAAGNSAVPGGAVRADPGDRSGVPEDRSDVPGDRVKLDVPEDRVKEGPEVVPGVKVGRGRRGAASKVADKVAERDSLEDEAQALWQRGELAAAELKYREVLRVAGGTRRAELAYGDLFALVRQMHGVDGQAAVWREYLGKFPAGRFADDARAGLCQRTARADIAACWRDYLTRHPDGGHRTQAEAALGGGL